MKDSFGRSIKYLRVSVTDRCNLRCRYCMPEEGVPFIPHEEILSFDEIERMVHILAKLGVERVRLTGGEPLARKSVPELAAKIRRIPGIGFLGLTTNGVLLGEYAEELFAAGVDGVNISLDTADAARYAVLTGRDEFARAMRGLEKALSLPFRSVRVNCVLSPFGEERDWLGVAALARELPVDVRFIEWMPMAGEGKKTAASAEMLRESLQKVYGKLNPLEKREPGGPAKYYRIDGFAGRIGVIPAMTERFCAGCDRVRLTSTGDLRTCLFYDAGVPLKPLLRGGAGEEEVIAAVLLAVGEKPHAHNGHRQNAGDRIQKTDRPCGMFGIGG